MDQVSLTVLTLILILVAHLVEEVRTGFRKHFPLGEMPIAVFVGINALVYAYCFGTLMLSLRGDPQARSLAWIFGLAMLINGGAHLGMMFFRQKYFPGGLTAPLLLVVGGYLMVLTA
jgi:hypothetical protein